MSLSQSSSRTLMASFSSSALHHWSYCDKATKACSLSFAICSPIPGMHNPWFKRRHCPVPVPVPVVVSYLNPFAASGGDGVVFINDYNCVTVTFPDLLAVTRGLTLLFACPALHTDLQHQQQQHWRRRLIAIWTFRIILSCTLNTRQGFALHPYLWLYTRRLLSDPEPLLHLFYLHMQKTIRPVVVVDGWCKQVTGTALINAGTVSKQQSESCNSFPEEYYHCLIKF